MSNSLRGWLRGLVGLALFCLVLLVLLLATERLAHAGCGGGMCGRILGVKLIPQASADPLGEADPLVEVEGIFAAPSWAGYVSYQASGYFYYRCSQACSNPYEYAQCQVATKLFLAAVGQPWGVSFCHAYGGCMSPLGDGGSLPFFPVYATPTDAPFLLGGVMFANPIGQDEAACGQAVGATLTVPDGGCAEEPMCNLPSCGLSSSKVGCQQCFEESCCAEANACAQSPQCIDCVSSLTPSSSCATDPVVHCFLGCLSLRCADSCDVEPPAQGGTGGMGGTGRHGGSDGGIVGGGSPGGAGGASTSSSDAGGGRNKQSTILVEQGCAVASSPARASDRSVVLGWLWSAALALGARRRRPSYQRR